MRILARSRVFALGAAVATMLALSLTSAATVNAAPPAQTALPQANVVVPNEVGKNVGNAIDDLLARGFGLGFRETLDRFCNRREFTVVRQDPAAGSVVPHGSVVTLTFVVWPDICP
jgi:beta-lactam-binding protein with PASTA domain